MKKRRGLVFGMACAALSGLMALGGCAAAQPETLIEEVVLPQNDGGKAVLTIGLDGYEGDIKALEDVLGEIIDKYEADYPNTEIRIAEGTAADKDIALIRSDMLLEQGTGWLMDMSEYMDAWTEEGTLSNPARRIMGFMGGDSLCAVPLQYEQMMLFYRRDWFDQYNLDYEDAPAEKVTANNWEGLLTAADKLGDKGRLTISPEVRPYLFDAIFWSSIGSGSLADLSAAYYLKDNTTIFSSERAETAIDIVERLLKAEDASKTPLEDFAEGRAGIYIGAAADLEELWGRLPGTMGVDWYAVGLPGGSGGKVVPLLSWTAFGVNKDSPETEKAVHFLAFLTNPDNNTHMYMELADSGVKPMYREIEAYEPGLAEGFRYGEIDLMSQQSYRYASAPLMFGRNVGVENGAFAEVFSGLESGGITGGEALERLDGEYAKMLSEYRTEVGKAPWENEEEG